MIKHYCGELGEFDYDDDLFTLARSYSETSIYCLEAKDALLEQKHIVIPKGITNCTCMFFEKRFRYSDVVIDIPEGVVLTTLMFFSTNLKIAPKLPSTLIDAKNMFDYCDELTTFTGTFPSGLVNMSHMFHRCSKLREVPPLPQKVNSIFRCFYGCYSLKLNFSIPKTADNSINEFNDGVNNDVYKPIFSLNTIRNKILENCFYVKYLHSVGK